MKSILEEIKSIIAFNLDIEVCRIKKTSKLTDLGADSLDKAELIMDLEEKYNLEILQEVAEKLTSVGKIVKYIEKTRKKS